MKHGKMRSLLGRAGIAASAALVVASAVALAAPAMALANSGSVSYNKNGAKVLEEFNNLDSLFEYAKDHCDQALTISLYDDWNTKEYGSIEVPEECNYEFKLNGHMINRGLANSNSSSSPWRGEIRGAVFYLEGKAKLTIDGGKSTTEHWGTKTDSDRFWKANGNGTMGTDVIYGGLITGGAQTGSELKTTCAGGAICGDRYEANVVLKNVTLAGNLSDNYGISNGGIGGAVCLVGKDSTFSAENSNIVYNHTAINGGGIYVGGLRSTVSLSGTKVEHNYADKNGGGIYIDNLKELSILNGSSVSYNYSGAAGGGINSLAAGAKITVSQSEIKGNFSKTWGGGINTKSKGGLTVSASTISNNSSNDDGGGIHVSVNEAPLTIEKGSVIKGNITGDEGGGIYFDDSNATFMVDNSTISQNIAKADGGGIYHDGRNGTLSLKNGSKIDSNTAQTGKGGGIYNTWGGTSFFLSEGSSISNNRAQDNGGGVYSFSDATYSLSGESRFYKNSSGGNGGGLCNADEDAKITFASGACFMNNTAVNGGGVYTYKSLTIEGDGKGVGGIKSNTAACGAGIQAADDLILCDISIMGNVATSMGGGVYFKTNYTTDWLELCGTVTIDANYCGDDNNNMVVSSAAPRLCFSDSKPLTFNSRIGVFLDGYEGSGLGRITESGHIFNLLGDDWSKVFSSDNKNYSVDKQNNCLVISDSPSAYELVIYGSTGNALPSDWKQEGEKVTLESASFVRQGCVLDYWEIVGVDGIEKLVPQDGKVEFTMPKGAVSARAHYKEVLNQVELILEDGASWSELGSDASAASVAAFRLSAGQSTSYSVYADDEVRKQVKVADVSVKDKGDAKDVTYTVSLSSKVLDAFDLFYDASQMKSIYLESNTSFDSAYAKGSASVDADGNATFTATVTLKAPAESVTVSVVSANQAMTGTPAFNIVVRRVVDLETGGASDSVTGPGGEPASETVVLTPPTKPGWKFVQWKSIPDGAIVDEETGTVIMAVESAAGAKLEAEYEPLASAVAITVKKPVAGEAFPSQIESFKVAGAAELDLTDQLKDSVKVQWTRADGSPAGNVTESSVVYKASISVDTKNLSYAFGMDDSCRVTVNGETPSSVKFDEDGKGGTIECYMTTSDDDSFDSVVELATSMVYTASDLGDQLPKQIGYRLKSGATRTADVTWDTSGVDTEQKSGGFSVPGTFTDEKGETHEVSKEFVIIELGVPKASYTEKDAKNGTQLLAFDKGTGWQDDFAYTISYRVCTADELNAGTDLSEAVFTEYKPGEQIELGEDEFIVAHAVVEVADGVTRDTGYEWYGRSLEFANIEIAEGSTAGEYGAEPVVTVKLGNKTLAEFDDYLLDYYDNDEVGEGWVRIKGTGSLYSGEAEQSFKINPATVTGVKAKASGKKKVKLSWSKHKENVTGFQVRYATSKAKLAKNKGKAVKVKGAAKKSYTAKKLKSGKKYFFKVRAYKIVDGKTYYSAWSKVKAAKAK